LLLWHSQSASDIGESIKTLELRKMLENIEKIRKIILNNNEEMTLQYINCNIVPKRYKKLNKT
jgi:hypothetical protein